MVLRVAWPALALACSIAACEKQAPSSPAPSPPPPAPKPVEPPAPKPVEPPAPEGAPVQTPPPPPVPAIDFSRVPDFGCIAWSQARELAACVIGDRGFNVGPAKVTLVFFSLGRGAAPAPLALLDLEQENPGPDELPEDVAERFEASLSGFTPLDRKVPSILASAAGAPQVDGSPLSAGGMSFHLRSDPAPPASVAPQAQTVLTARGPGGARHTLSGLIAPISRLEVRAFPLRDRANRSVVIVEQVYGVGDEGTFGSHGAAWRCTPKECQAP